MALTCIVNRIDGVLDFHVDIGKVRFAPVPIECNNNEIQLTAVPANPCNRRWRELSLNESLLASSEAASANSCISDERGRWSSEKSFSAWMRPRIGQKQFGKIRQLISFSPGKDPGESASPERARPSSMNGHIRETTSSWSR